MVPSLSFYCHRTKNVFFNSLLARCFGKPLAFKIWYVVAFFLQTNWLILSNSWIFLVEIDTGRKIGQPSCRFLVLMRWHAMSHDHSISSAWGIFNITRYQERCNELLLYIIWWICVYYIYLSICLSVCVSVCLSVCLSCLVWSDLILSILSSLSILSILSTYLILSYLSYISYLSDLSDLSDLILPYLVSSSVSNYHILSFPILVYTSIYLSVYLSIDLSTYLPIYLSTYLPTYLSIYLTD